MSNENYSPKRKLDAKF